jgi:hypothetical protein
VGATHDGQRVVAEAGVGKRGRDYGGGIISEPVRQRFLIQDRLIFLNIQKNLNEFKTLNERLPNSHEEFMEQIIDAGGIPLPELPAGETYVYDPERGELMVERPVP